ADLESHLHEKDLSSNIAIGHTRWATHGEPNDANAHPHASGSGRLAIIHNGIIENYTAIKQELVGQGHVFTSDTDTEVLIHFIEEIQEAEDCSLEEAVRLAMNEVIGAYAIVIMSADHPDMLIAARKGSPLVVGLGDDEFFLASDATPIVEYTQDVVYLNDLELAIIRNNKLVVKDTSDLPLTPYIQKLELELEAIEKGGFDHFMLKEIFEQPRSIRDCMRGRLDAAASRVTLGGLRDHIDQLV